LGSKSTAFASIPVHCPGSEKAHAISNSGPFSFSPRRGFAYRPDRLTSGELAVPRGVSGR
jgi:hypothetical protein